MNHTSEEIVVMALKDYRLVRELLGFRDGASPVDEANRISGELKELERFRRHDRWVHEALDNVGAPHDPELSDIGRLDSLVKHLRNYVSHKYGCPGFYPWGACSCGLVVRQHKANP